MAEKKEIIKKFPLGTPPEVKIKETQGYIRKKVIVTPTETIFILEKEEKPKETKKTKKTAKRSSSS